jgi:hypothetical protein
MNSETALYFLQSNQPMPADLEITQEECDFFNEAINIFAQKPDARCISLFVNSVSKNTGMGMYENISSVLLAHEREDVIPLIRDGLASPSNGVRYRCCWWAVDLDAWELEPNITLLLRDKDEDVRDVAKSYLDLKNESV